MPRLCSAEASSHRGYLINKERTDPEGLGRVCVFAMYFILLIINLLKLVANNLRERFRELFFTIISSRFRVFLWLMAHILKPQTAIKKAHHATLHRRQKYIFPLFHKENAQLTCITWGTKETLHPSGHDGAELIIIWVTLNVSVLYVLSKYSSSTQRKQTIVVCCRFRVPSCFPTFLVTALKHHVFNSYVLVK